MNAVLHARLDALEGALTALTDSLTAYSPAPAAAAELIAADDALTAALDQLALHQRNHAQIQALRATSAALDARFTEGLTALAAARATLRAVPLTPPAAADGRSGRPRAVAHADVLAAARNAVQFRSAAHPAAPPPPDGGDGPEPGDGAVGGPVAMSREESSNPGLRVLGAAERAWLDPADGRGGSLAGAAELPWPGEDMVARSGLARSQGWARAIWDDGPGGGVDGAAGPGAGPGEAGAEGRDAEMADAGAAGVAQQPRPRRPPEPEKRVFTGMELYDPDED